MELAMIGLGKVGGNMARRLLGGHSVVAWAHNPETVETTTAEGAESLENAVNKLSAPCVAWVMVPSGGHGGSRVETGVAYPTT